MKPATERWAWIGGIAATALAAVGITLAVKGSASAAAPPGPPPGPPGPVGGKSPTPPAPPPAPPATQYVTVGWSATATAQAAAGGTLLVTVPGKVKSVSPDPSVTSWSTGTWPDVAIVVLSGKPGTVTVIGPVDTAVSPPTSPSASVTVS